LREARELARQGVEEFSVIGQDTGDWGRDAAQTTRLPTLLRQMGQVHGIRWVCLMYMHPASFTEPLLDVFAENPDKFPYLDMPFQHIDSALLSEMKRKTDEAGLRKLIERIRARVPSLTLRSTFIVGFPGETDAQFERLLNFIKEGHIDYLGAFTYSQEENTPAAVRGDQLPEDVKKDRLAALMDAYYAVAHQKAQARIGTTETVILEETEGDDVLGRTRREAPEIDAVIRLPRSASRGGRFIQARLTGYESYEFTAVPS
jgi:ribosomal protein S12 methylthiotransferase